jgi:flagellar biogenesis protein FliO
MFKVERNLPTTSFIVPLFAILYNAIALLLILVWLCRKHQSNDKIG